MFPFYNNYPGTDLHEIDLAYILKLCAELESNNKTLLEWKAEHEEEYAELADKVEGLINNLVDVIEPWDSSVAYHIFTIVEYQGTNYIAIQDVPVGAMITDTDYWQPANTALEQINAIGDTVNDIETKVRKLKFWYYPEDFGAVGDGVTDDTAAFNSMFLNIPNGATILLKSNRYRVTNGFVVEKNFLKIVGQFARDEYGPGFVIDSSAGTFMTIKGYGWSFNHVAFIATERNNDQTFLSFDADNEDMSGNIDAIFNNCVFLRAGTAIRAKGRNISVHDSIISTCFYCLYIEEPSVITTDVRGFDLENNRIHSCIVFVQNDSTNTQTPKNIFISNNFCDMCDILFRGNGGGVVIADNYFDQERGAFDQCISINANPSGQYDVISGNTLKSLAAQTANIARVDSPVSVIGNTFINFGGGFTLTGECSVLSNSLLNVAENVSGVYPFTFGPASSGVCANNTVKSSKNITSATGANVQVQNNYYIR